MTEIEDEKIDGNVIVKDEAALQNHGSKWWAAYVFRTVLQLWVLWSDKDKGVATKEMMSYHLTREGIKLKRVWTGHC